MSTPAVVPSAQPPAPPVVPPPPPVPAPAPVEADKPVPKRTLKTTLAVEGNLGATVRVGSLSSGYEPASRTGLAYGAGLFFAPNRQWAFGLGYSYALASRETFNPTNDDSAGSIERRLHTLALHLRAYPVRSDSVGLFAGLQAGATWQTASASGATVQTSNYALSPAQPYRSEGGPNAGLSLGASVGMDLDLSQSTAMLTSVSYTNYRLTSDPLSGSDSPPVPGIGTVSEIAFRFGFQYRFDMAGQSPVHANVTTGSR